MQADLGSIIPLHTISSGKMILANYTQEQVNEIIEVHGLEARTEQTITDRETLFEELDTIAQQEYAVNDQESVNGLRSIGAPIFYNDQIVAGLDIAGPIHRLDDERLENELSKTLLQSINEIELKIEYE